VSEKREEEKGEKYVTDEKQKLTKKGIIRVYYIYKIYDVLGL